MVEELPTGYYLDNFQYLLAFVVERYEDILTGPELEFVDRFSNLSDDAQKSLVRLLGRRHDYVRRDKCQYSEITDFDAAIAELIELGLVLRNDLDDTQLWLNFATRPELVSAFPLPEKGIKKNLKKPELCEAIARNFDQDTIIESLPFDLLQPTCAETVATLKLLFFGNRHQDFTDFILHDLGVVPYEKYPLDIATRYFTNRQLLDEALAVYELQERAQEILEDEELCLAQFSRQHLLGHEISEPALHRRYSKLLNRVARQLERESEPDLAIQIYSQSNVTPARERQVRIYAEQGEVQSALDLCESMISEPGVEAEFEFAVTFPRRVIKKYKLENHPSWLPEPLSNDFPIEHLTLPRMDGVGVEETVAEYYRQTNTIAEHVENGLLPGLFGLLFWDAIFAPVKGVFFHPFQRGPADLFSDRFVPERRSLIHEKLDLLFDSERFLSEVLSTYRAKLGIANHFVMWRYLEPELIELAVHRIPPEHLDVVFRRMLRDLKHNRSGFPDLVLFPAGEGYELVEVKGPGDTLQANQKRWLRCFQEHGIPAKVVHVAFDHEASIQS